MLPARMHTPASAGVGALIRHGVGCAQEDPRIDHTVLKCTRDDHVITIASAGALYVQATVCFAQMLPQHVCTGCLVFFVPFV